MAIYAALGVPELWCWDARGNGALSVHLLTQPGQFDPSVRSPRFPDLDLGEFERFVRIGLTQGQSLAVRQFRAWVKKSRKKLP